MKKERKKPKFKQQKTKLLSIVVISTTSTNLSGDELCLLSKGLRYNLSYKPKNWIITLALEAETAVCYLPLSDQVYFRWQVTKNINRLHQRRSQHGNRNSTSEKKLLIRIKSKLKTIKQ